MAKSEKNTGWPGFFRLFAVLCAILCLLASFLMLNGLK